MIGKLQGVIDYIGDGFVILMVGGVGYKVYTPEILSLKAPATLWIETVVREDSIRLFGFSTIAGQNLFNQ
ncbi:MAG: Holliday junction branch migration protein RuvA, partial [Alphaproteobacteria bacterium]|nr:Holliday junction branch migration protein RuvA [Alphaproteobacteria bacterium]